MVIAGVATRFQVLQKTMGRWISVLTIINTFLLRLQPLSLVMDHTSLKNSICPINLGHNMFYNGLSVVSALACCWCPLVTPYHIRGCFFFCSVLLKPKWQLWRLQNGTSGIGDITVALSIFYMDQGTDWTFSIGEISISHMNWCGWYCSLT